MSQAVSEAPSLVAAGPGRYLISGPLGLEQVQGLLAFPYADGVVAYTIDLSGVTAADSAALALMLYWQRETKQRDCLVCYVNLPERLRSLIELYDLHGIVQLAE